MSRGPRRVTRDATELALLLLLAVVIHLPFLGDAFVLDDGNFVDQAQQILLDPAAPYSFEIEVRRSRDFYGYFANPPAQAYYLAGVIALFGNGERALHLACLAFVGLAIFAMYRLAQHAGVPAWLAALLLLASPAFLLSSRTVMADVPFTAFYLLAVWSTLRGVDEESRGMLCASGASGAAAVMLKYSGVTLVPLLLLYPLLLGKRRPIFLVPALATLGALIVWSAVSALLYGEVHLIAAWGVEEAIDKGWAHQLEQLAASLLNLGTAALAPPFVLAGALAAGLRRERRGGAVLCALALAALAAPYLGLPLRARDYDGAHLLLLGVLLASGLTLAALAGWLAVEALRELRAARAERDDEGARRSALDIVLCAWLLGFVWMNARLMFATPKYLLPALAPALLLLLGRGRGSQSGPRSLSRLERGVVPTTVALVSLVFGLALASVDGSAGNFHRRVIEKSRDLLPATGGGEVWFNNHWTVRHYARAAGYRYLPSLLEANAGPAAGDLLFTLSDVPDHPLPSGLAERLELIRVEEAFAPLPLALMKRGRAGYWASRGLLLPYVFSREPQAVARYYRLTEPRPPADTGRD